MVVIKNVEEILCCAQNENGRVILNPLRVKNLLDFAIDPSLRSGWQRICHSESQRDEESSGVCRRPFTSFRVTMSVTRDSSLCSRMTTLLNCHSGSVSGEEYSGCRRRPFTSFRVTMDALRMTIEARQNDKWRKAAVGVLHEAFREWKDNRLDFLRLRYNRNSF